MRFNVVNRKIHYWASIVVALPLGIIVGSGLLLQGKKQWTWVQPAEVRGTGSEPVIDLEGILSAARTAPGMGVQAWSDVSRIDLRVDRGLAKVSLHNGYEVQVDLGTGAVLQTAYRRSDLIESIHDGSFFGGDVVKLGVFLPSAFGLALLWLGGLWMWWVPFAAKRRRRRSR